jgi:outer membrane lipoprotein carrier protein
VTRRVLTALALLACSPVLAQEPLPPGLRGADKLAALIQRVTQVQAGLKTLTADFEQVRTSSLLAEPSHSHGRFYYRAPDSVRWDYEGQRAMTVLITGGVALTYRPTEKRAERIEVGKAQRRVLRFISAAEPLDKLRDYFTFTFIDAGGNSDYVLQLKPTTHMMKKRMRLVELEINRATFLPERVSYTEADGDSTVYTFSNVKLNPEQPPGLYSLTLPPDVHVVTLKLGHSE